MVHWNPRRAILWPGTLQPSRPYPTRMTLTNDDDLMLFHFQSSILPQFFNQLNCSCGTKWRNQCGTLPTSCPECSGPAPTPDFHCSTTESGWWTDSVHLLSGQTADFTATTSTAPAIVLGDFIVDAGAAINFGMNSALETRGLIDIQGAVNVILSVDDTVFLGNQFTGNLFHKIYIPFTQNLITAYSDVLQPTTKWNPTFDIPDVCHRILVSSIASDEPYPFSLLAVYTVTLQYQAAVKFRCSSWVVVIGVFGGVFITALSIFIICFFYTRYQATRRKLDRRPLLLR